jgi:hypothetical protein
MSRQRRMSTGKVEVWRGSVGASEYVGWFRRSKTYRSAYCVHS